MTHHASTQVNRRGFTLAELMVAMAIFGVIMTAAFSFLLAQGKSFRALAMKAAATQNGRFGRDIMRQELRTAGVTARPSSCTLGT